MSTTEIYLLAMMMIFAVPYLVWRLLNSDNVAPLVVVQIVGGVLLGPGVLGAAYPEYHAFVFSPQVTLALNGIAWWAVMVFVWIAGVELDLRQAWRHRGESLVVAGMALVTPLLLGVGVALVLLGWQSDWIGPRARTWQFVTGVGMGCAVTALPILVLFLEKLGILRTALGQRLLRYASFDDLAIWGVLALILLDWERIGRQGLFLCGFGIAAWLVRRAMVRLREGDRWYASLTWLLACAFLSDWAGLHYMVGAFLAGVVLDAGWFDRTRMDALREQVLFAFMPVFFLSTGLKTTWTVGAETVFVAAGLLMVASVAGKLLGVGLAGRMLGWPRGDARVIGWLLQTKGLIELIFANILLDKQIISNQMFTAMLLMAIGSTMLALPMVRNSHLVPARAPAAMPGGPLRE
ncbi:sodium:proton exchanger [Duganella sp. Leaf61]|uniref:cation:proton antiporter n=1 Tax=Duganella sp. Leaf61 TaxID=1736227 RepID=UPI0006FAA4D4|nr:cation:proton antiporter [Duganella sp. Leaf61]KQN65394.1 sodium:proton exchanger [Duganella sp. Leaf61]